MSKLSLPLPDVLTLGDAVSMWERALRAADKSPRTVGSYLYALAKLTEVAGNRPIGAITRADHEALMSGLQDQGLGAATRVAVQRPLRTFWKPPASTKFGLRQLARNPDWTRDERSFVLALYR